MLDTQFGNSYTGLIMPPFEEAREIKNFYCENIGL